MTLAELLAYRPNVGLDFLAWTAEANINVPYKETYSSASRHSQTEAHYSLRVHKLLWVRGMSDYLTSVKETQKPYPPYWATECFTKCLQVLIHFFLFGLVIFATLFSLLPLREGFPCKISPGNRSVTLRQLQ